MRATFFPPQKETGFVKARVHRPPILNELLERNFVNYSFSYFAALVNAIIKKIRVDYRGG